MNALIIKISKNSSLLTKIFKYLCYLFKINEIKGKTLIFIDEIDNSHESEFSDWFERATKRNWVVETKLDRLIERHIEVNLQQKYTALLGPLPLNANSALFFDRLIKYAKTDTGAALLLKHELSVIFYALGLHHDYKAENDKAPIIKFLTQYMDEDVTRANFWYNNEPLPPFGNKTAEQLVFIGRKEDVLRYLESLEAGTVG